MDALAAQARRSILIIGVNLEGALGCTAVLAALARSGGTVRLLAMDPNGTAIGPSATMSGVDPALRPRRSYGHLLDDLGRSRSFSEGACRFRRPDDGNAIHLFDLGIYIVIFGRGAASARCGNSTLPGAAAG
jgi:hypothetical protein